MSFNIKKENTDKTVTIETLDQEADDSFNIKNNSFFSEPKKNIEQDLGMEFLIDDKNKSESSESVIDLDDEEAQEFDPYMNEPSRVDPEKSYEEIQHEKSFYLSKLSRLEKRGFQTSRRLGMEHNLQDIKGEVYRIEKDIAMDTGIDYCRQGLMFCVSTIEMVNGTYNLPGKLNGWSQSVMGNIESYDQIFEELYDQYYSKIKIAPEIKLISMVAGSAFMFHLQKSLLQNESLAPRQREMTGPSMDTDELLRSLNSEVDMDDISEISENSSVSMKLEPQVKKIQVKKPRGRPKKIN